MNVLMPSPFQPALPIAVILGVGGVSMVLAVWRSMRGRALRPAGLQGVTLLLRLGAIAMLCVMLMNPSAQVSTPVTTSRSMMLVDESASMTLAGATEGTRWDEALAWSREVVARMKAAGLPEPEQRRFASVSGPLTDAPPTGRETRLAAALENAAGSTGLDHVIVVSDGCAHDAPRLSAALAGLRGAGIQVSTKVVGRDAPVRNAALLSVLPPRMVRAQSRVLVNVELQATGVADTDSFELVLRDDEEAVVTRQQVNFTASGSGASTASRKLSFTSPARTTRYRLNLAGPGKEATLEDNTVTLTRLNGRWLVSDSGD